MNDDRTPNIGLDYLLPALLVAFLAGLALVFAGLWVGREDEFPWSELLIGIGATFVSASIVAVALERYLKNRLVSELHERLSGLIDEFSASVGDFVVSQRLPPELLKLTRDTIFNAEVISRDVDLYLDMRVMQIGQLKALKAEATTVAIYENLKSEPVDVEIEEGGFRPPDRLQGSAATKDAGFVSARLEALEGTADPEFDLDVNTINTFVTVRDYVPNFTRQIELGPHARARITFREIAYFLTDDWDHYQVSRPTINLSVSVSVAGGKFKFKGEPDEAISRIWTGSVNNELGQHEWKINGALLPGQGLSYEWEPDETDRGG